MQVSTQLGIRAYGITTANIKAALEADSSTWEKENMHNGAAFAVIMSR